jgi:hypothetical protein
MSKIETRSRGQLGRPGPFLAEVTNTIDPTYMGNLEVALIGAVPNGINRQGDTFIVKYLSPFSGVTSVRFEGNNSSDFNDVQKSYGFWMVPPDVGTIVMVIFVDGDPNQGYWMGCIADRYQNHMTPGIAASKQVAATQEQLRRFGTEYLPVAEYLKKTNKGNEPNVHKIKKPIHPFADRLLAQGLLLDEVRGVTSSSARRDLPNSVFGISTPGPLDTSPGAKTGQVGYDTKKQSPVSRLGGTTFVMDDGDVNGQNELVRIRTRTGHQILLHNSHDLIYIANSKGTAWIELTGNGKIDIYAQDSISIHTEKDFNFKADRDINLEAGRNINVKANDSVNVDISNNYNLKVGKTGKILFGENYNLSAQNDCNITVGNEFNLNSGSNIKQSTGADFNINSSGNNKFSTTGNTNILSVGNHIETAKEIHMNGPAASSAESAINAEQPSSLPIFLLPNRDTSAGWANGNFYRGADIQSIMQRVPTHEPWDQHENIDPVKFSSNNIDVLSDTPVNSKIGT